MGFKKGTPKAGGTKSEEGTYLTPDQKDALAAVDKGAKVTLVKAESEPSNVGEWLTPAVGMKLEDARISRVMMIPGKRENEGPRPAYVFEVPLDGATGPETGVYMMSERSFMKYLRILNVGAVVDVEFVRQEGDWEKWVGEITVTSRGDGENIFQVLTRQWKELASGVFRDFRAPAPAEEVPF